MEKTGKQMADATGLEQDARARRRVLRELIAYFALTFTITFGLGGAFIFYRPQFEAVFGPIGAPLTSWPYYVAVAAPTISAVLVSFGFGGLEGVKNLFAGLIRRFDLRWLFVALLAIPATLLVLGIGERMIFGTGGVHAIDMRATMSAPLLWFTTAVIFMDPGPWGEETGWRGFALPRLLTRLSPLPAAILLGVIWSLWHTPAFFVSGLTQHGLNFVWFMSAGTCLTILMTWIYVNAGKNYFVAGVIPHAVSNLLFTAHAYNDIKIEALAVAVIAALIVAFFGPSLKGWRPARLTAAPA